MKGLTLLFILYKFVKCFLAITFLFFAISSWNLHDMRQRFFMYVETKFRLDPMKIEKFPHRPPILKIAHFGNVGDFLTMGVYGEIFQFLLDQTEISFLTK